MNKIIIRLAALVALVVFATANISLAAGGTIGIGNISVYKDGQLVSKLTGQNPVEDGALLVCDGKCLIKSEGISLIGVDEAQIAVKSEDETFNLYVKEGKVKFLISNNVRKISFITPNGTYSVAEVVFNASSQSVVKGSVLVNKNGETEISVSEGRLVFATANGMKVVDANQKIVLAVAPATGVAGGATAGAGTIGGVSTGTIVIGGVVTAGVAGGSIAIKNANDDDEDTPSVIDESYNPSASPSK